MQKVFLGLAFCFITMFQSLNAQIKDWGISLDVDLFSVSGTINRQYTRLIGPGVAFRSGDARSLSFTDDGPLWAREWKTYSVFNRVCLSHKFTVDLGYKLSEAALFDGSVRHGFSHLDMSGFYVTPMIGFKHLKLGTTLTFPNQDLYGVVWSPLMARLIVYL